MTKFGQAEYNDFMARIFADKLDKLLKESEKLVLSISLDTFYSNKNYATRKI